MTQSNRFFPAPNQAFKLGFACLLTVLPLITQAQGRGDSDRSRWYQVELIIFAQGGSLESGKESWRTDIKLGYPSNWLELVDPSQLAANNEEPPEGQRDDADGDTLSFGRLLEPAAPEPGERALSLLPAEDLTLRSEAQRLNRSSQHRVLFHGGWRQPMVENRREPAILITGGQQFGDHYELEGSIQLYLRTYLHAETNLWLTQFNTNFGQERRPWPSLPRRPNQAIDTDALFRMDDGATGFLRQFNQSQEYEAILAQPYVAENIVELKQSRRMRSGELHYIDHPKMGLLVKLIPYEPPREENSVGR